MSLSPEMQKFLDIAIVITDGDIKNVDLTCPHCGKYSLIFSFTVNEPPRHGLFIACTECKKQVHYSLTEKPSNFHEDLVLEHFQKLEDEAREFANEIVERSKKSNDVS